jgi:hypothetical protein
MSHRSQISTNPLIAEIHQLFSRDLGLQNDFLRQENKILRSKLPGLVLLTEADRLVLVRYGLLLKGRLAEVISIAKPETLLAWNRRQKQRKWTFGYPSATPERPRKSVDAEALITRLVGERNSWGHKRLS